MPIRVMLADDHAPLRAGLRARLADERGVEVVGEAEDGARAVEPDEPGAWAFHRHILPHAESRMGMFGIVTALVS